MNVADRTGPNLSVLGTPQLNGSPVYPYHYGHANGYITAIALLSPRVAIDLTFKWNGGYCFNSWNDPNTGGWGSIVAECVSDTGLYMFPTHVVDTVAGSSGLRRISDDAEVHNNMIPGATYVYRFICCGVDGGLQNQLRVERRLVDQPAFVEYTTSPRTWTSNEVTFRFGYPSEQAITDCWDEISDRPGNPPKDFMAPMSILSVGYATLPI